jgi:hypothetical protein
MVAPTNEQKFSIDFPRFVTYYQRMRPCATLLLLLPVSGLLAATTNQAITSHIHRVQVTSSAIATVGYSKHQHALEVEFRNGAIYRYLDVPIQNYCELLAAPSKASYYDANIRHRFHSIHVKPRQ